VKKRQPDRASPNSDLAKANASKDALVERKRRLWQIFKEMLVLVLRSVMGLPCEETLEEVLSKPDSNEALCKILKARKGSKLSPDATAYLKRRLLDRTVVEAPKQYRWDSLTKAAENLGVATDFAEYSQLALEAYRIGRESRLSCPLMLDHQYYDEQFNLLLNRYEDCREAVFSVATQLHDTASAFAHQPHLPRAMRRATHNVLCCTEAEIEEWKPKSTSNILGDQKRASARMALDRLWTSIAHFANELVLLCNSTDEILGLELSPLRQVKDSRKLWIFNDLRKCVLDRIVASKAKNKTLLLPLQPAGKITGEFLDQFARRTVGRIKLLSLEPGTARKALQQIAQKIRIPPDVARRADVWAMFGDAHLVLDELDILIWATYTPSLQRTFSELIVNLASGVSQNAGEKTGPTPRKEHN
jgi:hypothetical protein